MVEENGVPAIDMKDFPNQSKKLLKACEEWGFFRIINHRISKELMSEMKSVVGSPTERNPLNKALSLYDFGNPDAIESFCDQLEASPHQREVIKSYSRASHELIMEIKAKIAESMGLKSDFAKEWPCLLKINKYNFTEESHADASFFTILQGDECVGGLEFMNKSDDEFIVVDPSLDSLIIVLGDIAKAWSNGRIKNVNHRVKCKQTGFRASMASFFLGPPANELVEAPTEFVDSDHPRLYAPFTYKDFWNLRVSTMHAPGEALEELRLTTSA